MAKRGRKPKKNIIVDHSAGVSTRQEFLFPEVEHLHVRNAIERVKQAHVFSSFIKPGVKLHVAFSGGKDSVALYGVCRKAAEELDISLMDMCEFVFRVTSVDPPPLLRFVKEKYPFVRFEHPHDKNGKPITMWTLIRVHEMPPTRFTRFCCKELKETSKGAGYTLTGVRHAESVKRAGRAAFEQLGATVKDRVKLEDVVYRMNDNTESRRELEYCMQKKNYVCNPIIDWSDEQVWDFIREEKLDYCDLYDKGWDRIGCIGCPMATNGERDWEFEMFPKFRELYTRAFQQVIDIRKEKGKSINDWEDGETLFRIWNRFGVREAGLAEQMAYTGHQMEEE